MVCGASLPAADGRRVTVNLLVDAVARHPAIAIAVAILTICVVLCVVADAIVGFVERDEPEWRL